MSDVTPGPWMLGVSTNVEYGPWPCFRLRDMRDPTDQREIEADRRLMEAAPELLAALERVGAKQFDGTWHTVTCYPNYLGPGSICLQQCQQARAAIKHATEPKP